MPPVGGRKTIQPGLRPVGNAPLSPPAAVLPPEGEVLAALCLEMLMSSEAKRRANLPLRGRCRRQKGCISIARRAVVWFSRARQRGCMVFIPRSGIIKLIARKGDTTPSEPSEPSEPFEPSEPSRPKGRIHRPPSQPSEPLVLLYRIRYSKLFLLFLYFPYKTML